MIEILCISDVRITVTFTDLFTLEIRIAVSFKDLFMIY